MFTKKEDEKLRVLGQLDEYEKPDDGDLEKNPDAKDLDFINNAKKTEKEKDKK